MGRKIKKDIFFKQDDIVVYPAHGIGVIVAKEVQRIAGMDINVYAIFFKKDKMTLSIPIDRIEESGLRPLSSKSSLCEAIDILKSRAKSRRRAWSRKAQEYETKINSGDIISMAEVIRDLYKNVEDASRSYSERLAYEVALDRFASEYCEIENITIEKAFANIYSIFNSKEGISIIEDSSIEESSIEEVA